MAPIKAKILGRKKRFFPVIEPELFSIIYFPMTLPMPHPFYRPFNDPASPFGQVFLPSPLHWPDYAIISENRPPNQVLTAGAKLRALQPLNLLQHAFQTLPRLTFARALPASA
jgi:hypothetical protein